MPELEFVHVSSAEIAGDNALVAITADRRRIRSLVMKDFRRKERQRRSLKRTTVHTPHELEDDEDPRETARSRSRPTKSPSQQLSPTDSAPPVWRHSFGSRMAEAWFPAGHREPALKNIAYTYVMINSAPIIAIQDALSLLHAGSVARLDYLLLEARKRYVPVIMLLRREVSRENPAAPVARLGFLAMACLMCEVIEIFLGRGVETSSRPIGYSPTYRAGMYPLSYIRANGF